MNERGDAKLLWCYFSNKIYSVAVSYELLHVLFIMLNILYINLGGSHLLNSSVSEILWCDYPNEPFEVPLIEHTDVHANSPVLSGSLQDTTPISRSRVWVTTSPG